MIKLYQFPPFWGLPNISPFCLKLETYLRMSKIPFEIVKVIDPRKAPKGKLPYIDDQGRVIADTSLVIAYLKDHYGDALDSHLTPLQSAQALALQRLMEEHLYWCVVYSRWVDPTNWPHMKKLFAKIPGLLRNFIAYSAHKNASKQLHAQGLGRHTAAEVYQMGVEDLMAIHTILGENSYLMGQEPTSIDASGYAFIANLIETPIQSPLHSYAKSLPSFLDYYARMKERYYR